MGRVLDGPHGRERNDNKLLKKPRNNDRQRKNYTRN